MLRLFILVFLAASSGHALAQDVAWQASCGKGGQIVFSETASESLATMWKQKVAAEYPDSLCIFMELSADGAMSGDISDAADKTPSLKSVPYLESAPPSASLNPGTVTPMVQSLANALAEISGNSQSNVALAPADDAGKREPTSVAGKNPQSEDWGRDDKKPSSLLPKVDGNGHYVVQIASVFGDDRVAAETEWKRLRRAAPFLRGYEPAIQVQVLDGDPWTRLRVGPFGREGAVAFCGRIGDVGLECVVIQAVTSEAKKE